MILHETSSQKLAENGILHILVDIIQMSQATTGWTPTLGECFTFNSPQKPPLDPYKPINIGNTVVFYKYCGVALLIATLTLIIENIVWRYNNRQETRRVESIEVPEAGTSQTGDRSDPSSSSELNRAAHDEGRSVRNAFVPTTHRLNWTNEVCGVGNHHVKTRSSRDEPDAGVFTTQKPQIVAGSSQMELSPVNRSSSIGCNPFVNRRFSLTRGVRDSRPVPRMVIESMERQRVSLTHDWNTTASDNMSPSSVAPVRRSLIDYARYQRRFSLTRGVKVDPAPQVIVEKQRAPLDEYKTRVEKVTPRLAVKSLETSGHMKEDRRDTPVEAKGKTGKGYLQTLRKGGARPKVSRDTSLMKRDAGIPKNRVKY